MPKRKNGQLGKAVDIESAAREIVFYYPEKPSTNRQENNICLKNCEEFLLKASYKRGKPYTLFVRPSRDGVNFDNVSDMTEHIALSVTKRKEIIDSRLTKSNSIVVETRDIDTALEILGLITVNKIALDVDLATEPLTYKYAIKGVNKEIDIGDIWDALFTQKRQPYRVLRLKQCKGAKKELSDTILVYDITQDIPKAIEIEGKVYRTAKFWEKIAQCDFCKNFGHYSDRCKSKYQCLRCSLEHMETECTSTSLCCALCKQNHDAKSRKCIKYKREVEIIKCRNDLECTRYEAIGKLQESGKWEEIESRPKCESGNSIKSEDNKQENLDEIEKLVREIKESVEKKIDFLARKLFEIGQKLNDSQIGIVEGGNCTQEIVNELYNKLKELNDVIVSEIEIGALQSRISAYACAIELAGDIVDNGMKCMPPDVEEDEDYKLYKKGTKEKYLGVKKKLVDKEKLKSEILKELKKNLQTKSTTGKSTAQQQAELTTEYNKGARKKE